MTPVWGLRKSFRWSAVSYQTVGLTGGDFNQDGELDRRTYSMLATITFSMNILGVSGAYAEQVLVGDFNGDSIADLAVPFSYGNGTQPGPILFFTGDGHGGFADSTTTLFSGQVPTAIFDARILSGDFN